MIEFGCRGYSYIVLEFAWQKEDEIPASGDPVQNRPRRNQDGLIKVPRNTSG